LIPLRHSGRHAYFSCNPHRQPIDRLEARTFAPGDFGLVNRERQFRPALQQRFERASAFDARELMAETKMDSGAEGDVAVRLALKVEPLRMRMACGSIQPVTSCAIPSLKTGSPYASSAQ